MSAVAGTPSSLGTDSHRFYFVMALACAAVAFAGFAPTYWVPLATGTLNIAPIIHFHGLLYFSWVIFFVVQAGLVRSGNVARHRAFGLVGIALATAMVLVGILAARQSLIEGIALGAGDRARAFSVVALSTMLFFSAAITIAVASIRRPDVHKRVMLVATLALLQAAVARWFLLFLRPDGAIGPPPVAFTLAPGFLVDLLLVAAMLYDWRTRGRPHRVYVIGGGALLLMQVLRLPVSESAAWFAIADGLVDFMG